MQQRHRDQVLLHAEVAFGDGGELLGDGLVDLPVALGFPGRIGGRRTAAPARWGCHAAAAP